VDENGTGLGGAGTGWETGFELPWAGMLGMHRFCAGFEDYGRGWEMNRG
jgi:hypothetical protein